MSISSNTPKASRQTIDFNADWQFQLQSANQTTTEAEWRSVTLPHDWSIEQPFSSELEGATAYLPGGIGWYQKSFDMKELKKRPAGVYLV